MSMKSIAALVVAGAVGLAGCANFGSTITAAEAQLQQIVVNTCGFLPQADAIANIFHDANLVLLPLETIAGIICNGVPHTAAARMGAAAVSVIKVNGRPYVIHGQFVPRDFHVAQ